MLVLKIVAVVLSLGIDTLIVSVSLGLTQTRGRLKIAITFATAETLMPLLGYMAGLGLGAVLGRWAALVGGVILMGVAAWFVFWRRDDDEKLERALAGWVLIATAVSVSLDELAAGFSLGFIGVPVALTIALIGAQAFLITFIGLTFGRKLKPLLGEWSEKLVGVVLGLLGLWVAVEAVLGLVGRTANG